MIHIAPLKKVIIHVGEDHSYRGRAAFTAILEYLLHKGVSKAVAVRGIAGFGADHNLHTVAIERLTENLPIQIEFSESSDTVDELIPELCNMVGTGLIELQNTSISIADSSRSSSTEEASVMRTNKDKQQLMRIYIGENDRWCGKPLYQALVESMYAHDIAEIAVYQGIAAYGENGEVREQERFLASQEHPITIAVVESEEKLRSFRPLLDEMVQEGLIVFSDVETVNHAHDLRSAERRFRSR